MSEIEAWQKIREAFLNKRKSILSDTYSREDDETIARNGLCFAIKVMRRDNSLDSNSFYDMFVKITDCLPRSPGGIAYVYLTGEIDLYDEIAGVDCRLKFLDEVISSLISENKGNE